MTASLTPRKHAFPIHFREPGRGMLEEMENWMGRLWDGDQGSWFGSGSLPSLDVTETEMAVEAKLDLPGLKPEEIEIQLNNNMLTVSGERKEEEEEKGKTYHRVERRVGNFSRSITLPCSVEEDEVVAAYNDGVLTITLPKTDEAKTRKIKIKT